jgi:hypothetical protein
MNREIFTVNGMTFCYSKVSVQIMHLLRKSEFRHNNG